MNTKSRLTLWCAAFPVLAGCADRDLPTAPVGTMARVAVVASLEDEGPLFSEWSAAVNLGAPVNTMQWEQAPTISRDGLSIFFHCGGGCPGNVGGTDLWVSQRASLGAPWEARINLSAVNTPQGDGAPAISRDGHHLYFNSNRAGGFGRNDVWLTRRQDQRDVTNWSAPVNLGPGVNTSADEGAPFVFEDEVTGVTYLYFNSDRAGGSGGNDLWVATLQSDGTFGGAQPVVELNTPFGDQGITIRRDGLEAFFSSDRPGGQGQMDVWRSTRASTADPWGPPENLGPAVNHEYYDAAPDLSFDGTTLYYNSAYRPGEFYPMFDIMMVTRTRLKK